MNNKYNIIDKMNGGKILDKYEYNVKSDQIKKLYSRKEFEAAAKLADEIDWYRVKDNAMLNRVADIYENVKQYDKAKEVLLIAYERSPLGRQLAYKLTILAIRTKNFVEADEFYQDFVEMSPSDVSQYLLKYRIAKAKGEDIEVLIKILEAYVDVEMDERWQYELAKLYHEAGMDDKCIAMCDEVELWFNDGKYVDKAKELRRLITGMLNEYKNRYAKAEGTVAEDGISDSSSDNMADNVSDITANESENEDKEVYSQGNYAYNSDFNFNAGVNSDTGINSDKEDIEDEGEARLRQDIYKAGAWKPEIRANAVRSNNIKERADITDADVNAETEEERMANEALKAAEAAALEAQRAADMAKQLVREARLRAEQVKSVNKSEKSPYAKMTAEEISRSLEEEEMLKGNGDINKRDSMIEIFEFDKDKEGKGNNIGEELTKTAEIDIDQINIKLADADNLYNTANIQAALAKSMEKLLDAEKKKVRNAFTTQIDEEAGEIRPIELTGEVEVKEEKPEIPKPVKKPEAKPITPEPVRKSEVKAEIPEPIKRPEAKPITPEPVKSPGVKAVQPEPVKKPEVKPVKSEQVTKPEVKPIKSEPIAKPKVKPVQTESVKALEVTPVTDNVDEPTKRIDRDELNRILNASKMISESLRESYSKNNEDNKAEQEEQVKGQMTSEEMSDKNEETQSVNETADNIQSEGSMTEDTADGTNNTTESITENTDNISNNEYEADTTGEEEEDVDGNFQNDDIVIESEETLTTKNPNKIPEEYRSLFDDFIGTKSMEEVIAHTLDNLINNFVMDGTSKTNNIIVTGSAKIGKTTLGLSLIKAANRGRKRSGRKVAKVKASALNKRGVALAMTQILGTDLIIEQAGNLMPNTIVDLMIAMKNYTEEMLIVLEDDKAAIDRLLSNAPELQDFFTNRLDIHEMDINDMVKIAKEYAEEQLYAIDEIGELALYVKLDNIIGKNPVMSIEDIQEVIDEAIEHSNRFSIGKLFGKIRKNKGEMGILTEQDFL